MSVHQGMETFVTYKNINNQMAILCVTGDSDPFLIA